MIYAHVTTQRILNKFIELNFSVGCRDAVYFKPWLFTSKTIDKIPGLHEILFNFLNPILLKIVLVLS